MKNLLLIAGFTLLGLSANAQLRYNSGGGNAKPKENGFDPQKLVIGGGFGGGLGNGITSISVAPLVGYKFLPNLMAGVSLSYQYMRVKDDSRFFNTTTNRYESYPSNYHLFSPGLWARVNFLGSFFAHAQFEYHLGSMSWMGPATFAGGSGKEKVKANYGLPSLLVGAGYRMPLGERTAMYFGLYYDVLQSNTETVSTASNGQQFVSRSPYWGSVRPMLGFGIGF